MLDTGSESGRELTESSSGVSEEDLEVWVTVEGSGKDESGDGEGGFEGETGGELEDVTVFDVASVVHFFVSDSIWISK